MFKLNLEKPKHQLPAIIQNKRNNIILIVWVKKDIHNISLIVFIVAILILNHNNIAFQSIYVHSSLIWSI